VVAAARRLRDELRSFDPTLCSGAHCADLVPLLASVEKACAAVKARAAARAASCGAHRDAGFADASDWLASASGSSTGEAAAALKTVSTLESSSCDDTIGALVAGDLSLAQAREIAATEAERPGSEAELLGVASSAGLTTLRERARARRHEAIGDDELHRRRRAARSFRHWVDDLGNVAFRGEIPPEVGVPLMNRLDAECDRTRRAARRAGSFEHRDAHAADAFVQMMSGAGRGRPGSADVVVVVDLPALRRGHTEPGERCHVIGGGRVPVSVVRSLIDDDAFIKAVVFDGVDITTVSHVGRYKKAELRTALALGPPPAFEGVTCCEPGCDRRYHLEWDHVDPVANRGPTSYANLTPRCWPHHRAKTERDRRAGLLDRDRTRPPP
jgi:hypothetical protein